MRNKLQSSTRKAELASKQALTGEEKLVLVAKVSADAIYDWDMVAGVTSWNHGLYSLFGYEGDSVQKHTWWEEHIHPEDKDRVIKSITNAHVAKEDYWTDEYRFLRADGTYAFVIDRGYFIYDENEKRPLHEIGAVVDITSRVVLAEAQAQSAIEERQRLARDLHDSVTQTLFSLTLIAEATIVILQIESPEALEQVEQIAAVPGYDALLFGPGDFSHRIGKLGQATCPEVVAARKRVHAAAIKHGKYVAVATLFGQKDQLIEEGTRIFTLGADVIELGNAFHKLVKDFGGGAAAQSSDSVYANKK